MQQFLFAQLGSLRPALLTKQARGWLLLLLALLGSTASVLAQTVTIGSTAVPVVTPATSSYLYGPIYRSSAASTFNYSRYAYIYTAAELNIPAGATISQLEWLKSDAGTISGSNTFNVLLNNTTAATLTSGATWGTLSAGATNVYSSTTQTVTGAAGSYLSVPAAGFTYTGGNLLVLTDWALSGSSSGVVNFVTNLATGLGLGYADSAPLSNTTALSTTYGNRRPTLRLTYVGGTACTAPPTAGTAVASPASMCAGGTATLSLSGTTYGAGLTYQWQSSSTSATTGFTNIAGATSSSYVTPVLTQTMYYRAVLTCSGQSATSTVATVTVLAPTYATLPYTQGFENTWLSRCNTNDAPDANWLNTPSTGNTSWRREDDGATASWTSPTFGAYTPTGSQGSSHSARFHSSYATSGSIGTLDLYADLSAAGNKRMTFDYISVSTGVGKLDVLLSTDGGVTFGATPLLTLSTATTFTAQTVDLSAVSATAVIRFRGTSDYGSYDIGVDNVQLRTLPSVDIAPTALATPTSTQGCYGTETVAVTVRNQGSGVLNFATNPATVSAVVTTPGGGSQTLTGSITTGTLAAGATQNVTLTPTLNMTTLGTYTFAITATVTGDGNTANDVLTPAVTRTATAPVAGTLSPATGGACVGGSITLTLSGYANGTVQYQQSTSATGPFTNITGATSATYVVPTTTVSTVYYRAQVLCGANVVSSNVSTITVANPQVVSTNSPVTACFGGPATLTATASAGSLIRFFTTATGGTVLTSTTPGSYTTPNLTANTTYYAEAYAPSVSVAGLPSNSATYGTFTQSTATDYPLGFSVSLPGTLESVDIYPTAAGTLTIRLYSVAGPQPGAGTAVAGSDVTITVTAAQVGTKVTVPLNYVLTPGDYKLSNAVGGLGRYGTYTGTYPLTSASGAISVVGSYTLFSSTTFSNTTYNSFFNLSYNAGCTSTSARTPIQVNVAPLPTAGFSYPTTIRCIGTATTLAPTLATGATAGTFTLPTTTGLTINATTGVVTVGTTAAAGTYTVTNTVTTSCNSTIISTATFTLSAPPTSNFAYSGTSFCQNGPDPTPLITGTTGGTFSSTTGLNLNATTGTVNLYNSTAGTYTVTYTITTPCGTSSSSQTVSIAAQATAGFAYLPSFGCTGSTSTIAPISLNGGVIGTFTVTPATGLVVNASTGAISLSGAVAGTYTIVNTVNATSGCGGSVNSTTFTVSAAPAAPTLTSSANPQGGILLTSSVASGNQFYRNGVAIAGATGQTYVVNSGSLNGSYTVTVSNAAGCTATSNAVVVAVTATVTAQAGTSLTLYPNPTRDGLLTLELSGYREAVQLRVLNALGQRVYEGTVTGTGLSQAQALNLSALPSGVYTLQARTASGSVETRRIVRE